MRGGGGGGGGGASFPNVANISAWIALDVKTVFMQMLNHSVQQICQFCKIHMIWLFERISTST